jgi:glutathionylspermidine synthase
MFASTPIRIERNSPRPNWQQRTEEDGLIWHSADGLPYWSEDRHVVMTLNAVEILEDAANEVHGMCMQACQSIIDRNLWNLLDIPAAAVPLIKESWEHGDVHLYGRFDFAWDGTGTPKLLEYNADTPTSLLEASVIQWRWLQECFPGSDQLNSLHEALVERWRMFPADMVHFACVWEALEDRQTIAYLAETAEQAGKAVELLDIHELGYNRESARFTDLNERFIDHLFKLYPWEWMAREEFFTHVARHRSLFTEPIWKMMLSNKGLLPILWELFPNHPLLLPAFFNQMQMSASGADGWAVKPFFGREGAGVRLEGANGQRFAMGAQAHLSEPVAYQALTPLFQNEGDHFVWGLWMIGDECRGLSARADQSPVTGNLSRFLPHRIEG